MEAVKNGFSIVYKLHKSRVTAFYQIKTAIAKVYDELDDESDDDDDDDV